MRIAATGTDRTPADTVTKWVHEAMHARRTHGLDTRCQSVLREIDRRHAADFTAGDTDTYDTGVPHWHSAVWAAKEALIVSGEFVRISDGESWRYVGQSTVAAKPAACGTCRMVLRRDGVCVHCL